MRRHHRSLAFVVATFFVAGSIAAQTPRRITTDRSAPRALDLPDEDDAFTFVIFGDRTGGPASGVEVLRQAVADANLLDPDLVMTVGDLVEGYNTREPWLDQMTEYRSIMGDLHMPWFPVAGNHDIYWRGDGAPPEEHEADFERHFGPLWYAFEHKRCWFIVLYSDEANPDTGERNFNKPECQRMSAAQLAWLDATLEKARGARHVFLFMHHPRWLSGRYGDDWDQVHERLVRAGNVTAVFAGHIHQMRYDGRRDGIEHFTLATVGAYLDPAMPRAAGFLHQFHVVTVRDDGIHLACVPVGTTIDPRAITGKVNDEVTALEKELTHQVGGALEIGPDGAIDADVHLVVTNPISANIEIAATPVSGDRRFAFSPDHTHLEIYGHDMWGMTFHVHRDAAPLDENFSLPEFEVECDYLGENLRVALLSRRVAIPFVTPRFPYPPPPLADQCLELSGNHDALAVDSASLDVPDGPFTVEAWLNARTFAGRRALVAKTEESEFGLFVSDGKPHFFVHLDGAYVDAGDDANVLTADEWHHVAGVFDGAEARLYVDGHEVAAATAAGTRTRNDLPLFVGADPDASGRPTAFFDGLVDEVRVSRGVRYVGDSFEPRRPLATDDDSALHLTMDAAVGPWVLDASRSSCHARKLGGAHRITRS